MLLKSDRAVNPIEVHEINAWNKFQKIYIIIFTIDCILHEHITFKRFLPMNIMPYHRTT